MKGKDIECSSFWNDNHLCDMSPEFQNDTTQYPVENDKRILTPLPLLYVNLANNSRKDSTHIHTPIHTCNLD